MKKRLIALVLLLALVLSAFVGCGNTDDPKPTDEPAAPTEPPHEYNEAEILKQNTLTWETDFKRLSQEIELPKTGTEPSTITKTYTWVTNEVVFNSVANPKNAFDEFEMDLILTDGTTTYTIPCFWDGKQVWRARFYCPTPGNWSYKTVLTKGDDAGLNNQTGAFVCEAYTGNIPLYKHGFVTTQANTKHFVYADGTPFFYFGDTHWNLGSETVDMMTTIAEARAKQGFTVIQSEPLGASFDFTNSISTGDMKALQQYDQKFQQIADCGLMHANASFFYPSSMAQFIKKYGGYSKTKMGQATHVTGQQGVFDVYDLADSTKEELRKICRYWVARYSAYPVMWTLGQEVDNDFFWNRDGYNSHQDWSYANNPYRYVAQYISQYDAYKHPLTAHQESVGNTDCSASAFRDLDCHTWYASQWSQNYDKGINQKYPKDYWENGQGKPCVMYEGKYCYLWTKNFGARIQGYMVFLSGMCGYGWGGQDTWSYKNTYSEDADTNDGVDIITAKEKKAATWQDSLKYDSVFQVGYLRAFLEQTVGDWWNLTPCFDDEKFFVPDGKGVFYLNAGDNTRRMLYFYNTSSTDVCEKPNASEADAKKTGTIKGLDAGETYVYLWFNPITGQKVSCGKFTPDANGAWAIGEKAVTDMALYVYKL